MALENQDFTFYSGNDGTIRIGNIRREDTGAIIPVSDILGATWAITSYEEETTPLIEKSLSGGTIVVPEDGVVNVILNASDTVDLSGEFSHELRLLANGNKTFTACRGKMTIRYQIANNPV